jgi:hypothetical protein
MPNTRPPNVTAVTATGSSAVAVPARTRPYLAIYNQSASDTVAIAFDGTAAAIGTAGCISLTPTTGGRSWIEWNGQDGGFVPSTAVNIISSSGSTAVTIVE